MPLRAPVLALLPALALAAPLAAQQLDPLDPLREVIGDGEAPISYIGTRCAAFYVASTEVLGDQVDAAMQAQVDGMVSLLFSTAVSAMVADGMTPEDAEAAATAEIIDLTAAYRARFAANSAQGGPAFAEDPVYRADSEDCLAVLTGE